MPFCTSSRVSSCRRYKPIGQVVVTLSGKDVYLGKPTWPELVIGHPSRPPDLDAEVLLHHSR